MVNKIPGQGNKLSECQGEILDEGKVENEISLSFQV